MSREYPVHGLTGYQLAALRALLEGQPVTVPTATWTSLERRGLLRATYVLTDTGTQVALNMTPAQLRASSSAEETQEMEAVK